MEVCFLSAFPILRQGIWEYQFTFKKMLIGNRVWAGFCLDFLLRVFLFFNLEASFAQIMCLKTSMASAKH